MFGLLCAKNERLRVDRTPRAPYNEANKGASLEERGHQEFLMKQSLLKLVDVILRKIDEHPEVVHSETLIRSWLQGQGYNKRDIEAAMKLVRPRFVARPRVENYRPVSIRMLSAMEAYKLSPEARDALARLDRYGVIDVYEREEILDRLGHFEGIVGLDELDYLLASVVYGARDVESQQTIFNILEGPGETIH